ncbi:NAD-dependent epimerase/dehydratase family protein, partial [Segatella maculosa]|uniref:NAD-dependent epimerase/dehydratase family protein n=1 Tax=Segatella maculosa TaxID=439703 RepID=UPI0024909C6B
MNHILKGDLEFICSNTIVDWSRFNHKKILITGVNGMLPAYMVFTLLYLNEKYNFDVKVIALVRNINKAKTKFADYLTDNHLTFLVQDVAEQISCKEHIDFIIHAASQASPKYYGTDPVGTIDANLFGTTNTLKLAHEHHCESYLYFSSGEVYGIINKTKPSSETDYG